MSSSTAAWGRKARRGRLELPVRRGGRSYRGGNGQVLAKVNGTDYKTQWIDQSGGAGTVAVANGGTGTASTLTGLVRGSSSAMTAAELSGDVTTAHTSGNRHGTGVRKPRRGGRRRPAAGTGNRNNIRLGSPRDDVRGLPAYSDRKSTRLHSSHLG